jgi:hypothetical protein
MSAAAPYAVSGYEPANEVERRLAQARGDGPGYLRILAGAPLYLPVIGGTSPHRPPAWLHDGVPHLAVFTSVDALRLRVTGIADGYRVTDTGELVERWPDPRWRLAVNPGTPLGVYLPVTALRDHATGRPDLVEFDPAWAFVPGTEFERVMYLARTTGRPDRYLDALVVSRALMPTAGQASAGDLGGPSFPWLVDIRGPDPVINVFTSPQRLTAAGYPQERAIAADFIAIVRAWPDTRFGLAVNPGSAIAALFAGPEVARLTDWARRLAHTHSASSGR